ncbi:uncharacterized protein E1O_01620 [Burkholderiales bacterium GJ-E10]|nr:uncharacterized protein E1O_01620 [Burkholderiales bacterium GJ-E10]
MKDHDKSDAPPFVAPGAAAQAAAAKALFAALKAKRAANAAATAREFAIKSVRGLRPVILDLFDSGATTEEVLAILQQALPTIAPEDMQFALSKTRDRHRLNKPTAAPPRAAPGSAPTIRPAPTQAPAAKRPAPPASGATQPGATNSASPAGSAIAALGLTLPPWADGSDKLPTESDEDYVLRKNLETPPDHRRKFIGEQNS